MAAFGKEWLDATNHPHSVYWIILWLVWMIEDGQAHDNAYGSVPTNLLE
ncbi:MAG: hypothetical protein VX788_02135 [Candidatus Thermoplasmatota archaeon]|nr:hypothetical protein [Candidatus Thermoplasmatota archaeon]MEC9136008.1 hypothetical protein [Candidatus Thermoplasmatota archaeon]